MLIKDKYFCFIDIYLLINSEIFLIYVGNIITVKSITYNELWKLELEKKLFFDIKNLLSITVVANNFVFLTCSELSKL